MGQLIAGAGPEGLTQTQVAEQLGVTDDALLDAVIDAVADHDGAGLFGVVEQTVESGHDVRRFVTDLLHRFRDLMVIHHAGAAATADVLDVSEDRRELLAEQAARFGPTEFTRYADVVNTGLTQVKGSTSPRLQLEILAARLLVPHLRCRPGGHVGAARSGRAPSGGPWQRAGNSGTCPHYPGSRRAPGSGLAVGGPAGEPASGAPAGTGAPDLCIHHRSPGGAAPGPPRTASLDDRAKRPERGRSGPPRSRRLLERRARPPAHGTRARLPLRHPHRPVPLLPRRPPEGAGSAELAQVVSV